MNTEQMSGERFAELCKLLPEGVSWCDPITPPMLDEVLQAALNSQAKSVPDIVVVNNMIFDGDSHYGTREGDVFVMDDGDVYTYEHLKSEYECEWYYAAPQQADKVRELEKDAARYRWLCENKLVSWAQIVGIYFDADTEIDQVIDEAMKGE